ncbi:MAG: hypothetical protein C0443_15745, partial [Comamonadaceae bacterium]|nr:hypothetical protein [Comamonadaceae bacterium]
MDTTSHALSGSATAESLANCATEAIHLTQWVQRYGLVLACDAVTRRLERTSQNIGQFLAIDPAAALGSSMAELVEGGESALSLAIKQVTPGTPQLVDLR